MAARVRGAQPCNARAPIRRRSGDTAARIASASPALMGFCSRLYNVEGQMRVKWRRLGIGATSVWRSNVVSNSIQILATAHQCLRPEGTVTATIVALERGRDPRHIPNVYACGGVDRLQDCAPSCPLLPRMALLLPDASKTKEGAFFARLISMGAGDKQRSKLLLGSLL